MKRCKVDLGPVNEYTEEILVGYYPEKYPWVVVTKSISEAGYWELVHKETKKEIGFTVHRLTPALFFAKELCDSIENKELLTSNDYKKLTKLLLPGVQKLVSKVLSGEPPDGYSGSSGGSATSLGLDLRGLILPGD